MFPSTFTAVLMVSAVIAAPINGVQQGKTIPINDILLKPALQWENVNRVLDGTLGLGVDEYQLVNAISDAAESTDEAASKIESSADTINFLDNFFGSGNANNLSNQVKNAVQKVQSRQWGPLYGAIYGSLSRAGQASQHLVSAYQYKTDDSGNGNIKVLDDAVQVLTNSHR